MATIDMGLFIGIIIGKSPDGQWRYNYLPDNSKNLGYPVETLLTKRNACYSKGAEIINEIEVGDTLRQVIQDGEITLGIPDAYDCTLSLQAIARSRQPRFLAVVKIDMFSSDNIMKTAILLLPHAFLAKSSDQYVSRLGFPSKFARIDFTTADYRVFFRQAEKQMNDAASTISSTFKIVRF